MEGLGNSDLVSAGSLGAGISSYLLYFHHGERYFHPYRIVNAHILAAGLLLFIFIKYFDTPIVTALKTTLYCSFLYFTSLFSSTLFYRLLLNPLNRFPGAPLTGVTRFSQVYRNRHWKSYHVLREQHNKYGKYIRVGPNELSITDPEAVKAVAGTHSKCTRGPNSSVDLPLISLQTMRSRAEHDARRKIWAPAFSPAALKGYEARIQKYTDEIIAGLKEGRYSDGDNKEMSVDASKLFHLYGFDVMGDLAFGKGFGMLKSAEVHWAIDVFTHGLDIFGLTLPPWVIRVLINAPGLAKDHEKWLNFAQKQMSDRMNEQLGQEKQTAVSEGDKNRDITHLLIEHHGALSPQAQKAELPLLLGDSGLIIAAGSDTTSTTLIYLFYYLAKDPKLVQRLRDETKKCLTDSGDEHLEHRKIIEAQLLNGVIYETLRLNPPVASGVFRKTPKEGIMIGHTHIPGDTVIQMPYYAMGHDEDCYVDPESFLPERWFPENQEKMVKHKDAFQSFNSGPYGCIGKNLAMMELRMLIVQLLQHFDVALAHGEDGQKLFNDTTDVFLLSPAPLKLVFTPRNT